MSFDNNDNSIYEICDKLGFVIARGKGINETKRIFLEHRLLNWQMALAQGYYIQNANNFNQ
jgi:hypothetical protein